jgi:tryptophan synthase beta chain
MRGKFNEFGGQYVSKTLMSALNELEEAYEKYINDKEFLEEYKWYLKEYVGRPTPLYYAENMSNELGFKVYLKREDLNHTGAHKINNTIGQVLLAKRMGKKNIIAETGAGQHGVATATVCAKFNMNCIVFMGMEDIKRQNLNVRKMKLLGAKVIEVQKGEGTLKDAVDEAINYWVNNVSEYYYLIGSVVGPHPYPKMVRDFQKIIGEETKKQILEKENRLPDKIIAAVGGGSNAIGIFYPFIKNREVELIGIEAAGLGIETGKHAASMVKKDKGILHGMYTYLMKDESGNLKDVYSISAGLDYPGVGPEHAYLESIGRAKYKNIKDDEAIKDGVIKLTKTEGVIPALESAHAIAYLKRLRGKLKKENIVIVNLSGRGDKDMDSINNYLERNFD